MANTKVTKILMRQGTQQEWINADSVAALEIGEIGFESDTYRMKIGNIENDTVGTLFKDIDYFAAGIVSIQEVDTTHENGLMIDLDGKLELDIGNLVGRIDNHDTVLSDIFDSINTIDISIDNINIELDRIENQYGDSIEGLIDSVQEYADTIEAIIDESITQLIDSIGDIHDSIDDIGDLIDTLNDEKVDRAGDTMFGTLSFSTDGIIEAIDSGDASGAANIYLRNDLTLIQTDAKFETDVEFNGDIIKTNDNYFADKDEDNDVVDVKSSYKINKANVRTGKQVDGGNLYRSTGNPDRIVYTPSIHLAPIATDMLVTLNAMPDSVEASEIRDTLIQFFTIINNAVTFDLNDPVEFIDE